VEKEGAGGGGGKACRALMEKPEQNRPAEGARCRWEINFKMYVIEIGWEDMD